MFGKATGSIGSAQLYVATDTAGGLLDVQSLCNSPQLDHGLAGPVGPLDRLADGLTQCLLIDEMLTGAEVAPRCRQCLSQLVRPRAKLLRVRAGALYPLTPPVRSDRSAPSVRAN